MPDQCLLGRPIGVFADVGRAASELNRVRKEAAMATFWTIVTMAYTFGVLALIGYATFRMFSPHER
jgi:hypothetical protein